LFLSALLSLPVSGGVVVVVMVVVIVLLEVRIIHIYCPVVEKHLPPQSTVEDSPNVPRRHQRHQPTVRPRLHLA
jgi:hypothetical protein